MSLQKIRFQKGTILEPDNVALEGIEGELKVGLSDGKLKGTLGGSSREVLTDSQTQTVINKTLDIDNNTLSNVETDNLKAGVLNTSTVLAGATNTQLPSALAVKTYVDDKTAAQNEASEISFAPTGTISATNVQAMGAELDGDIQGHITDTVDAHDASAISVSAITNLAATEAQAAFAEHQDDIDDLVLLSGRPANAIVLGTFTGTTIPDASNIKDALQALETAVETKQSATLVDSHILVGNGSNVATDVAVSGDLTLTNTGNFQIASGAIVNADINASAAIDASKIADGSVSSTEFQYINSLTSNAQTQIDSKITGPASSTDKHLVRFDGTTGKLAQDGSTAVLSDAGALTGLTGVTSSGTAAFADVTASGSTTLTGTLDANGLIQYASANDNATGSNVTLTTPTTKVIRLTNASLASIDGIPAGVDARELILENATGTTVAINEDTGATAANRFYTGTTTGINLADKASIALSYDSTSSRWRVIGGTGGSGSQVPDTFVQLVADELLTTWATGDNATFLGGGTLAGTFVKETSTPLNGTASYKYTQAASSLDDYLASPVQSVPVRFRGNAATCTFSYKYDGANSDIEPIVYDVTNSAKLTTSTNLLPAINSPAQLYKVNVSIPSTCTQIRVGFHVKALNSGKILQFDDIQVSSDTTKYAEPLVLAQWQTYTPTFTGFGTVSTQNFRWRQVGESVEIEGRFTAGTTTATEARISLPNSYTSVSSYVTLELAGTAIQNGTGAASFYTTIEPSLQYFTFSIQSISAHGFTKQNGSSVIASSGVVSVKTSVKIAGLSASNPQIVTASESFSTDTASLVYAGSASYTLSTLADAPVGTFITFTVTGSTTDTMTQTNAAAPTQTTSSMNTNGIQMFCRTYAATSTSASPAVVAIQIGKNFNGVSITGFMSTGKTGGTASLDSLLQTSTIQIGMFQKDYNPVTGILLLDLGSVYTSAITTRTLYFSQTGTAQTTSQTNGYFVINASKSPALVGVPQVQPRFATLSDVKSNNTNGGTSTSGSFQTRTLNTLVDSTGIVTSLSSNQFVLQAGEYFIEATAPAYFVSQHVAKIRNITDSTDALLGTSEYADPSGSGSQSCSIIKGSLIITAAKTFELQHRTANTSATTGFGSAAGFGINETYSVIKITKVK